MKISEPNRGVVTGLTALAALFVLCGLAIAPGVRSTSTDVLASTRSATTSSVIVDELGSGHRDSAVDVDVPGPVTVTYRRLTIEPGAGTGLHCHYGQLVGVVESGELTHYAPIYPGGVHVYKAGEALVEGSHYVHEGQNTGDKNLVLLVTYITPQGKPLAESDLTNCTPHDS